MLVKVTCRKVGHDIHRFVTSAFCVILFVILVCVLYIRYERLEEQLNDLTELHQNEMTNLKQELASMEEKVAYQSYERARDIQVKLENSINDWKL